LRISIYQQSFALKHSQTGGQIDGRSGFAYASFLIRNGDNFAHS
jgi:hypothetical protein